MEYTKQTFIDNVTVLTAEHLNHIEDGIEGCVNAIGDIGTALDQIIAIQNTLIGGENA